MDRGDVLVLILRCKCFFGEDTAFEFKRFRILRIVLDCRLEVAQRAVVILVTQVELSTLHVRIT